MVDANASRAVQAASPASPGLLGWWRQLHLKSEGVRGYTLLSPTILLMLLSLALPLVAMSRR